MKSIKIILIMILCLHTSAYADFRKALDALQRTQGTEMLVEVEHAVKTKNNDGLSLFLNTLSNHLHHDAFYIETTIWDSNKKIKVQSNLLLAGENITRLMALLKTALHTADFETQFDFAILRSKFTNKKNRFNVSTYELKKFSALGLDRATNILAKTPLYDKKNKRDLKTELSFIRKSAKSGNSESAVRLAIIYLHWSPFKNHPDEMFFRHTPVNNKKGIYWLRKYNANPIIGDFVSACKLADEYAEGKILKQDNEQAYLWYMESNYINSMQECSWNGLRKMASSNALDSINPDLATFINSKGNFSRYSIHNEVKKIELPRDIQLFSTHIDNNLVYSIKEDRYKLEIFRNGKVKFEGYNVSNSKITDYVAKRKNRISSHISGRDEWEISKDKVNQLIKELSPLVSNRMPRYITESVSSGTSIIYRHGIIKINLGEKTKAITYRTPNHRFYTAILARIFNIQERTVPTQYLRCGANKEDNGYKNCVIEDMKNFKRAVKNKGI